MASEILERASSPLLLDRDHGTPRRCLVQIQGSSLGGDAMDQQIDRAIRLREEQLAKWAGSRGPDPRSRVGSSAFQGKRLRGERVCTVRVQEVSNRSHVPGMGWKRG